MEHFAAVSAHGAKSLITCPKLARAHPMGAQSAKRFDTSPDHHRNEQAAIEPAREYDAHAQVHGLTSFHMPCLKYNLK